MNVKPKIGLCMICKNEANVLPRSLNSVKDIISYYCICDDVKTTDNSEEIIKDVLKDIPGEYHKCEWKGHAYNRNLAMDFIRSKVDWMIILDADDYFVVSPNEFQNLNSNYQFYNVLIKHNSIEYYRPLIINSKANCKFVGVVHEYLDGLNNGSKLNHTFVTYGGDGSSHSIPDKFLRDAKLLEEDLIENPDNPRSYFYLAQSYRDANDIPNAIKNYEIRSNMNKGWIDEVYISLLELGKIYSTLPAYFHKVENTLLRAFIINTNRSEALIYLSKFFREQDEYFKSFLYSNIAIQILKPKDALFIEHACYTWKPLDEFAISAYFIGKYKLAADINKKLLNDPSLPNEQRNRIIMNLRFCESKL
jgi:tetratricopeptide (TPR) repeat protein